MVQKIPSTMTQSGLPPQFLVGFETYRDPTTPTKRIVVSPGSCRSQLNDADLILTNGIMKRLDQTWAAGSGNGGLDQGALTANVWYHCFVIMNTTTGIVDVLFSGSVTNPLLPAGFTIYRRVWSVRTDASSNIMPYTQTGDWCAWGSLSTEYTGNLGASSTVVAMRVPIGMKIETQFLILTSGAGGGEIGLMDPDSGDPNSGRFYTVMNKQASISAAYRGLVFTDVNGRTVGWADANITASIQTIGYRDPRGKL
ncbi:hypothetical protein [Rhizobium laguerreae]|uniref:hypothetical protein n=1 Tax=Rhizobium laguerreae TaxID=1076926 RepID=UPI001C90B9BE|nr:hypothetical protein [Rhizobium laguerreae]MBY3228533.1 hypothetical protein [Rhizobium laguerreae]